jgi:hypothetical protein
MLPENREGFTFANVEFGQLLRMNHMFKMKVQSALLPL